MKTPFFSTALSFLLFYTILFMSCGHKHVQQFTVDLQYSDGSKESYAMYAGSMLLVNHGDMHVVAKVISGNDKELELQVTRYAVTLDSVKKAHTIQKAGTNTNKISLAKSDLLDPAGTVQVTLNSVAFIDTGRRPKGACQGNCCEAKCFSTFCCTDPDECKNAPCDCKPPSNCPVPPTNPQASHFFELFLSGKELMVFQN
jgi:hypothetical protein